jgi:hypothetical protein
MSESQSSKAIQEAISASGMASGLAFLLPPTSSRTAPTTLARTCLMRKNALLEFLKTF